MKVLIAGLGSIGQRHISNIANLESVEVLAYRVRKQPLPPAFDAINITAFDDLDKALAEKPEIAIIASPPARQLDIAIACAAAGCHIMIEKPVAASLARTDELKELIERNKLISLVGYNLRFHPSLQKVKHLLDEGTIGKVISIKVQVGQYLADWHPWEDYRQGYSANAAHGGGVLLDLIHEIDYIRWLMGEPEKLVAFAKHASSLEIDTEDIAEILINFRNGVIGNVHLDYIHRTGHRNCEIIGEKGSIYLDLLKNEVRWNAVPDKEWKEEKIDSFVRNDMYVNELKHFLDSVRQRKQTIAPIANGLETLNIALAAKKSALENKIITF